METSEKFILYEIITAASKTIFIVGGCHVEYHFFKFWNNSRYVCFLLSGNKVKIVVGTRV